MKYKPSVKVVCNLALTLALGDANVAIFDLEREVADGLCLTRQQAALSPLGTPGCAVDDSKLLRNLLLVSVQQTGELLCANGGVETEEAAHVVRWQERLDVGQEEAQLMLGGIGGGGARV